jgi:hypothetical protein
LTYFKINDIDFSQYVNKLKIGKENNFKVKTNARGKLQASYITTNYIVEVGIIPIDNEAMQSLQAALRANGVSISFLDADTGELKTINAILTKQAVEYYTIQDSNIRFNAFALTFTEAVIRG